MVDTREEISAHARHHFFYSRQKEPGIFNILLQPPTKSSMRRWKGKKQNVTFDETGKRLPTEELDNISAGVAMNDVWEIPVIAPVSKERIGYPTQKPQSLLERIIEASSRAGDTVLDPFCGCGTAVHAAEKLRRQWTVIERV